MQMTHSDFVSGFSLHLQKQIWISGHFGKKNSPIIEFDTINLEKYLHCLLEVLISHQCVCRKPANLTQFLAAECTSLSQFGTHPTRNRIAGLSLSAFQTETTFSWNAKNIKSDQHDWLYSEYSGPHRQLRPYQTAHQHMLKPETAFPLWELSCWECMKRTRFSHVTSISGTW